MSNNELFVTADMFGSAREIRFFIGNKQAKNLPVDREHEVYFHVEYSDDIYKSNGYVKRTEELDKIFSALIQDHKFNQHIHFIDFGEGKDVNVVFGDGMFIGQRIMKMEYDEFIKFQNRIKPYQISIMEDK